MTNEKQVADATNQLHELIAETTRLADERAKENRLKEQELSLKQEELNQHQIELDQRQQQLDLETRRLETERQANTRRDRLNADVMQRYIHAIDLLVTTDERFAETVAVGHVERKEIRDELRDVTQAVLALLTRDLTDMGGARTALRVWDNRAALREEMELQQGNLNKARKRAAKFGSDIPTSLANEIETYETAVAELEEKLGVA